jgi:calcineurin-like phosphoesterase family protein
MNNDVFFTSDTHFNHAKCCELFRAGRFSSLDEMNETMIERWNSRVKKGDRVYHLGDVALGRPEAAAEILSRLSGQVFLIRGNHETVAEHQLCRDRFVWIKDYFGLKVGEQKIYLCHYAFRTWNGAHKGCWHLYGHSHGTLPELETSRAFDAGVDCWDFYPVSFDEVAAKMATKLFEPVDHHAEIDD